MKIKYSYNLKLKTDLIKILNKNFLKNKLVKPIYNFVKLVTKTNKV